MKKIIGIIVILFCAVGTAKAQFSVVPHVDERTELMGIVFRLAGAEEYSTCYVKDYANDIDAYFAPYKNHELIKFAQKLRANTGVGYSYVMSLATYIEIVNQEIKIKDNIKQGSINRYLSKDLDEFVKLLNRFYEKSRFHTFFERHHDLYQIAEENFNRILEDVDFGWFEKFFGMQTKGNFSLIISFVNGPNCYGPMLSYTNKPDDFYAIMTTLPTKSGEPTYTEHSQLYIPSIIHEFNHSFCNPLIDEFYPQLKEQGDALFEPVKVIMQQQAYGISKIKLYEILVRACVIKYFASLGDNPSYIERSISGEFGRGFLWIEELVGSLSVYEQNRDKYPTLRDYMPEIVKLQNSLSPEDLFEKFSKLKTKN